VPVDLTIAMDAFTRCIIGVLLTPLSTKARDVANVLYQAVTPPRTPTTDDAPPWPFHGVPR
jgi:putative transposase